MQRLIIGLGGSFRNVLKFLKPKKENQVNNPVLNFCKTPTKYVLVLGSFHVGDHNLSTHWLWFKAHVIIIQIERTQRFTQVSQKPLPMHSSVLRIWWMSAFLLYFAIINVYGLEYFHILYCITSDILNYKQW